MERSGVLVHGFYFLPEPRDHHRYTFAGIRPQDAPAFILSQLSGALLAYFVAPRLVSLQTSARSVPSDDAQTKGALHVEIHD
jgi:hypothetical protein